MYIHTYLNIKSCIETHLQMSLTILLEHSLETLLEDSRVE